MKKKKIERIIDRLNSLIDENPRLIYLNCKEARELLNKINSQKSKIIALEKFFDEFRGVL